MKIFHAVGGFLIYTIYSANGGFAINKHKQTSYSSQTCWYWNFILLQMSNSNNYNLISIQLYFIDFINATVLSVFIVDSDIEKSCNENVLRSGGEIPVRWLNWVDEHQLVKKWVNTYIHNGTRQLFWFMEVGTDH